jgi:hypothetical protein
VAAASEAFQRWDHAHERLFESLNARLGAQARTASPSDDVRVEVVAAPDRAASLTAALADEIARDGDVPVRRGPGRSSSDAEVVVPPPSKERDADRLGRILVSFIERRDVDALVVKVGPDVVRLVAGAVLTKALEGLLRRIIR